jgi:hypothetical protein
MTSLSSGWLVVVFSLPVAALVSFCGWVAWAGRSKGDGATSDWSRRLLAFAVGLMPKDRREWGGAMLAELEAIRSPVERWRFSIGCLRVALFPPASARWPRSWLDWARGLSPGCGALSVLLPLSGLPLLCVATIVLGGLERQNHFHGPGALMETRIGVVLIAAVAFIASGLPLGIAGLARGERRRWLSVAGPIFSASIFPYLFVVSLFVGRPTPAAAGADSRSDPAPREPIGAVLDLFEGKRVVALSDLHGCSQELDFLESLISSPDFLSTVNVLTWELGNSRYQSLMDEYILDGAMLPLTDLQKCWRENTQANLLGDTPRLVELLAKIRDVNRAVEKERRLRVLLIDPPVDWSEIQRRADVRRELFDRDAHIAKVIEDEVYSKGKKALFFAGPAHLVRRKPGQAGAPKARVDSRGGTALDRLESAHPGTTASVWVHGASPDEHGKTTEAIRSWPKPSVAAIRGTWYETLQQPALMKRRPPRLIASKPQKGVETPLPPDGGPLQGESAGLSVWDAVLYLGAREELTRLPTLDVDQVDAHWAAELRRRRRLLDMPDDDLFRPFAGGPYFPPPRQRSAAGPS